MRHTTTRRSSEIGKLFSVVRQLIFLSVPIFFTGCTSSGTTGNKVADSTAIAASAESAVTSAQPDGHTFLYEPAVSEITGVICKRYIYGIGNKNDSMPIDTIIVIALKEKIAVIQPTGVDTTKVEVNYPNERNVDTIEIFTGYAHGLHKYFGRTMQLKGMFFHASKPYHYTDVLLTLTGIKDIRDSSLLKQNE